MASHKWTSPNLQDTLIGDDEKRSTKNSTQFFLILTEKIEKR